MSIRFLLSEIRSLTEANKVETDLGAAADLATELISAVSLQTNDATAWKALRTVLKQQLGYNMSPAEWKTLQTALLKAGYQKGKDLQGEKGVRPPKDATKDDLKKLKGSVRQALSDLEPEPDDTTAPTRVLKGPDKPEKAVFTKIDEPAEGDLRKMVSLATSVIDKAGKKGLDWDSVVREVGKRRGGSLSPDEQERLSAELEKLGIDFADQGAGKIMAKAAIDPEKAAKGVELATQSVDEFEQAMKDVLDQVKIMDPAQGQLDKERRTKLDKLIATLKNVVGGATGALQKATQAEPKRGLLRKVFGR